MPLTNPDEISNGVSLSHKLRGFDRAFVPENSAINSLLSAIVNEASPNENSIGCAGSKEDDFAWSDTLLTLSAVRVSVSRVVSLVHGEAGFISVLR